MSLSVLFTTTYWFGVPHAVTLWAGITFVSFFGAMLIVGLTFKSVANKDRLEHFTAKILARWGSLLLTMSLLGFLYLFFRYERTMVFSLRWWFGIWLLGTAYWAYRLISYQIKKVPELRDRHRREAEKYAYLPRKIR